MLKHLIYPFISLFHPKTPSLSIHLSLKTALTWATKSFFFFFAGTHTSRATGQPPRRAAPAEPGRAGPRVIWGRGQAGERGPRWTARIVQGEHDPSDEKKKR